MNKELKNFRSKVEIEGLDYAIREYSGEIKDLKFQKARQKYLDAAREIAEMIEMEDYD